MKKVAVFLLAFVMVAGFAACGGGGGDDDDGDHSIRVTVVALPGCVEGVATGTFTNLSTGYVTPTISVNPNASVEITLPEEGSYRMQFRDRTGYWDYPVDLKDNDRVVLDCGGKMIQR